MGEYSGKEISKWGIHDNKLHIQLKGSDQWYECVSEEERYMLGVSEEERYDAVKTELQVIQLLLKQKSSKLMITVEQDKQIVDWLKENHILLMGISEKNGRIVLHPRNEKVNPVDPGEKEMDSEELKVLLKEMGIGPIETTVPDEIGEEHNKNLEPSVTENDDNASLTGDADDDTDTGDKSSKANEFCEKLNDINLTFKNDSQGTFSQTGGEVTFVLNGKKQEIKNIALQPMDGDIKIILNINKPENYQGVERTVGKLGEKTFHLLRMLDSTGLVWEKMTKEFAVLNHEPKWKRTVKYWAELREPVTDERYKANKKMYDEEITRAEWIQRVVETGLGLRSRRLRRRLAKMMMM